MLAARFAREEHQEGPEDTRSRMSLYNHHRLTRHCRRGRRTPARTRCPRPSKLKGFVRNLNALRDVLRLEENDLGGVAEGVVNPDKILGCFQAGGFEKLHLVRGQ